VKTLKIVFFLIRIGIVTWIARSSILRRYERDLQGRVARKVAEMLKTRAYVVLFREGCSEFWVYDLSFNRGWAYFDAHGMESFLKRLK